jgi:serine phosphatase RsbU (regulator of sigma subunit)
MRLKHPLFRRISLGVLGTLLLPLLLIILASLNYVEQETSLLKESLFEKKSAELSSKTQEFLRFQYQVEKGVSIQMWELAKNPLFSSNLEVLPAIEALKTAETEVLRQTRLPFEDFLHLKYYRKEESKPEGITELKNESSGISHEFEKVLLRRLIQPNSHLKLQSESDITTAQSEKFVTIRLKGASYRVSVQYNPQADGTGFFLAILKVNSLYALMFPPYHKSDLTGHYRIDKNNALVPSWIRNTKHQIHHLNKGGDTSSEISPESIYDFLTQPQGARFRLVTSGGEPYLGTALPSFAPQGFVHIFLDSEHRLQGLALRFILWVIVGLIFLSLYFLVVCLYFSNKITSPIQKLTLAVESSSINFDLGYIQDFDPQNYPELSIIRSAFKTEMKSLNDQFALLSSLSELKRFLLLQPNENAFIERMRTLYQGRFNLNFLDYDPDTREIIFEEGRFTTGGNQDDLLQEILSSRNKNHKPQNQDSLFHEQVLSFYDRQALEESFKKSLNQEREFEVASSLQLSLLPKPKDSAPLACHYCPARFLGGDFFDFSHSPPFSFYLIADVAGKGLGPALYALMIKSTFDALYSEGCDLEELMYELNYTAFQDTAPDSFCTLFLARVDHKKKSMDFVSAGHNQMLLLRSNETRILNGRGLPLGILETSSYSKVSLDLLPDDLLFLYTDGCTEAANSKAELFGFSRLEKILRKHSGNDPSKIKESLLKELDQFTLGTEQSDDIAFVIAKLLQG